MLKTPTLHCSLVVRRLIQMMGRRPSSVGFVVFANRAATERRRRVRVESGRQTKLSVASDFSCAPNERIHLVGVSGAFKKNSPTSSLPTYKPTLISLDQLKFSGNMEQMKNNVGLYLSSSSYLFQ